MTFGETYTRPIEARHSGVCGECDTHFPEGTLIQFRNGSWVHDQCPEPKAEIHPVCQDCWLIHPPTEDCP